MDNKLKQLPIQDLEEKTDIVQNSGGSPIEQEDNPPSAKNDRMKRDESPRFHMDGRLQDWAAIPVQAVRNGVDSVVKPVMAFKESFKTFIESRNVVEVAVAFVMGLSFRTICTSLVDDLVTPIITYGIAIIFPSYQDALITEMFWTIRRVDNGTDYATRAEAKAAKALTVNFGNFLKVVFDFLVLCFALYLFITFFYLRLITEAVNTNPCPQCQEDVKESAIRCPHCSQLLPQKEEDSEQQTNIV